MPLGPHDPHEQPGPPGSHGPLGRVGRDDVARCARGAAAGPGATIGRAGAVEAPRAAVRDPGRGHLYLTRCPAWDAAGPGGLLCRWTPPVPERSGPGGGPGSRDGGGRPPVAASEAGDLKASRCFDSGGRFVDDLSRVSRLGAVLGVDWVDVPDGDGGPSAVPGRSAARHVTRVPASADMWWGDGGLCVTVSLAGAGEGSAARRAGAVWFYNPSRRTLTLKALTGAGEEPTGADAAPARAAAGVQEPGPAAAAGGS